MHDDHSVILNKLPFINKLKSLPFSTVYCVKAIKTNTEPTSVW